MDFISINSAKIYESFIHAQCKDFEFIHSDDFYDETVSTSVLNYNKINYLCEQK